jgi:antitoxin ParD1/3/4
MGAKISISLTDEHARLVNEAVASGDYASSSEVIREALRDWRGKRLLGRLWDEGIASGHADEGESIAEIKDAARRRRSGG